MSPIKNILVTGGSGKTGRAVVKTLAALGYESRVAARNPVKFEMGEYIPFDWMDEATHDAAVSGIDAVYIVAPTLVLDPVTPVAGFIEKAMDAGVRRFVLLSSSAIPKGGPAMGQIHEILEEKAQEWAVMQPSWFMQNFTEGHHGDSIRKEAAIYSATGTAGVGFIDANDIGATVAHCLVAEKALGRGVVLTGPSCPNYDTVAKILSKATGRTIRHVSLSKDELAKRFEQVVGMPTDYAEFLAGLDAFLSEGSEERVTSEVQEICGKEPVSFESFATKNVSVWQDY